MFELNKEKIDEILGKWSIQPWLYELILNLINGNILQKLVAIGLLARLWHPIKKIEQKELLQSLLEKDCISEVEQRCLSFIKGISEIGSLEKIIIQFFNVSLIMFYCFSNEYLLKIKDNTFDLFWLWLRDDMECLFYILKVINKEKEVKSILNDFDILGKRYLEKGDLLEDCRLETVLLLDANAWWAKRSI